MVRGGKITIKDAIDAWPALFDASHNIQAEVQDLQPQESVFLHYCPLHAFYEIMDSGRLRFTSARSTNDPSEFNFGLDVVRAALKEPEIDLRPNELKWFEEALTSLDSREFRAFVFCMSEAKEDEANVGELSQWRLYGADGRGVALVFDVSLPQKMLMLKRATSVPRKVLYGATAGKKLVRAELHRFISAVRNAPPEAREHAKINPIGMAGYIRNVVFWLPSVIKHQAYRHEREVRLVRGDIGSESGNPLTFFERSGIRRPAIELQLAEEVSEPSPAHRDSPISHIVIGPSGDQGAIADSIKYFLEARGWNIGVRKSDIPYRTV